MNASILVQRATALLPRAAVFGFASLSAHAAAPVLAANPSTLHQEVLTTLEPDGRRPLAINPPTLRWPAFGTAPYTVELSRSENLASATPRAPVKNTFDRPAQPLEPGGYWWRVTDAKGATQPIARFEIGSDVAKWPIPT